MSHIKQQYLVAIEVNPNVSKEINAIRSHLFSWPFLTSPLPHLIPLFNCDERPANPVPGLLPHCNFMKIPGDFIQAEGWIVWKVDSGSWFDEIMRSFEGRGWVKEMRCDLLPCRQGIPLIIDSRQEDLSNKGKDKSTTPELKEITCIDNAGNLNWHSIKIVCYKLQYFEERPWYKSVQWCRIWHRRLCRVN